MGGEWWWNERGDSGGVDAGGCRDVAREGKGSDWGDVLLEFDRGGLVDNVGNGWDG